MAEFGAAATLELTVSDRELRDARQEIEDGIGDVEVGVSTPPSRRQPSGASAVTDGGFDSVDTLLAAQLEQLEDIHDEIEKMAASGGPGGGSTGGTILQALGARSVLGGVGSGGALAGGSTALGAAGIMAAGGIAGKMGNDALRKRFPENFAPKSEGISGTSFAFTEEDGIGGSAEPLIKPEEIQQMFEGIDVGLESQKPQWLNELDSFQIQEPKWVNNLDQQVQFNQPAWVSNFDQNVQISEPQWVQDLSGIEANLGDMNFDLDIPLEFNPSQVEQDLRQAFDDFRGQLIDEVLREVEQNLPDLGDF